MNNFIFYEKFKQELMNILNSYQLPIEIKYFVLKDISTQLYSFLKQQQLKDEIKILKKQINNDKKEEQKKDSTSQKKNDSFSYTTKIPLTDLAKGEETKITLNPKD